MEIKELVMQEWDKLEQSGFIEKTINEKLQKTIASIIGDLLETYGEFDKGLKAHLKEQLQVDLDKMKLEQYNLMLLNALQEQFDHIFHTQGMEKLKETAESILVGVKKEYRLSELVEKMKADAKKEDEDMSGEISFHINPDRHILTHIYLDPEEDKERYECKYRLAIDEKEGTLRYVEIGDRKIDNRVIMGGLFGFEKTLLQIYVSGAKIILDEDAVDCEYESNDY